MAGSPVTGSPLRIVIEYCEGCGYAVRLRELVTALKGAFPGAQIDARPGPPSSFEVYVNNQKIYSKKAQGLFPAANDIINHIKYLLYNSAKQAGKR